MLIKNTTKKGNKICVLDTHSVFYNFFMKKRHLCSSKYMYFIRNFFLIGSFGDWKIYALVYKFNTTFKIQYLAFLIQRQNNNFTLLSFTNFHKTINKNV